MHLATKPQAAVSEHIKVNVTSAPNYIEEIVPPVKLECHLSPLDSLQYQL